MKPYHSAVLAMKSCHSAVLALKLCHSAVLALKLCHSEVLAMKPCHSAVLGMKTGHGAFLAMQQCLVSAAWCTTATSLFFSSVFDERDAIASSQVLVFQMNCYLIAYLSTQ